MKITKTELKQMITEAVHQALKESSERDRIDADRDYKLKKRGLREGINKIPRPWNKYFEIAVDANEYNGYEDDKACNNGYDELEHITFVRLKPEYDYDDFAIGQDFGFNHANAILSVGYKDGDLYIIRMSGLPS